MTMPSLAWLLVPLLAATVSASKSCQCKSVSNSFIVTRLWNIIDPEWTDQMVIDEFQRGFAPLAVWSNGFQEYAASFTSNNRTVYFMNIFETREAAKGTQEAAKIFVQKGILNGVITPNQFTENELSFHYYTNRREKEEEDDSCTNDAETLKGKYMGTQVWSLKDYVWEDPNSTTTQHSILDAFEQGLAPAYQNDLEGLIQYGGSFVPKTDLIFFYTVFDTLEAVQKANALAEGFVLANELEIYKVAITEGEVRFDYTPCSSNDYPPPFPPSDTNYHKSAAYTSMGSSQLLVSFLSLLAVGGAWASLFM